MDTRNYASLEASRRLAEAGIVLETEAVWAWNQWPESAGDGRTIYKEAMRLIAKPIIPYKEQYPAPCMAEVWRELPGTDELMDLVRQYAMATLGEFWQATNPVRFVFEMFRDINRLIDLLIWVTAQKEGGRDELG